MKRIVLLALPLALVACGEIDLPEVEVTDDVTEADGEVYAKRFTFTVKGDFCNVAFVDGDGLCDESQGTVASSMAVPVVSEPTDEWGASQRMSRANTYMTADGAEMTDLWVVDVVDGVVKQSLHQTNADDGWGAPQMALTLGTHHVMFLASRGQGAAYADGVVTWTKPLDTFYLDYEVTVAKTSNGNRSVTLDRCASNLRVVIDDALPAGTATISLTPGKWYNGWNMLTGVPVAATDYVAAFDIREQSWGSAGVALTSWTLSGSDEWTTDVTVTSRTASEVNATATLTAVPLKANRSSVYHGRLYSATSNSSVALNTEWLPAYEGVY